MSVGCNTLLLPGGSVRPEIHSRRDRLVLPNLPVRSVGSKHLDAAALIPPLAATVIPRGRFMPQIRNATATACLIRTQPAMDQPLGVAANRALTLIWARRICSPRAFRLA